MQKKINFIILYVIFFCIMNLSAEIKDPDEPDDPEDNIVFDKDADENSDDEITEQEEKKRTNLKYKNKSGKLKKGIVEDFYGFYLTLSWEGNEDAAQQVLIDFVKAIKIKAYKMIRKKIKGNVSRIYYYPYVFDILMKDGSVIKNAKGRIDTFDFFVVYNSIGKEKCFTYFVRYWLDDKEIFTDTGSSNYNESPDVPGGVIVYLEFEEDIKVFE